MGATMNESLTLTTDFAPAERATPEQVEKQFIAVKSSPAVQEIFNRIPHIAFVLNHERQIVYANRCLLDFLGFSENNSVSGDRPGEALRCIHSSETEGGCGTTRNCSTCGAVLAILAAQSTGEPQMRECRITRQVDNDTDALDLRVWTDQLTIEEKTYTVMLAMDISDEKRRRVLERVFFHDIKNTATALQGSVYFLTHDTDTATAAGFSNKLRPLVDQLIREIMAQEQLLAAENNELTIHSEPVSIKALLEELCDSYRDLNIAIKRTIEIYLPEQDQITTDRTVLERIISNMLKNALEASSPNDTIEVGCKHIDSGVRFWVSNPQYMMKDIQLQLFQRSFSTKGMNRGIGTYSIKLLTERYLHGHAGFTSTPHEGTTFFVDLPT
jgi:signal transduction histidine kinase